MVDGLFIRVFVVFIFIDMFYIIGIFEVWCMEKLVYDFIIGNVEKVRLFGNLDLKWLEVYVVEI